MITCFWFLVLLSAVNTAASEVDLDQELPKTCHNDDVTDCAVPASESLTKRDTIVSKRDTYVSTQDVAPLPNCTYYKPVDAADSFDMEAAIEASGPIDASEIPSRTDEESMKLLVEIEDRSNLLFTDDEKRGRWCGVKDVHCKACESCSIGGGTPQKCADRLVTKRMKVRFELLLELASHHLPGEMVVVEEAFEEPTSAQPDFPHAENSLHKEGRAMLIRLQSRNIDKTSELTRLSSCCLFNNVQLRADHMIMLTVQKNDEELTFQPFPYMYMSACSSSSSEYEGNGALLFDSEQYKGYPLTKSLTIANFLQPELTGGDMRCIVPAPRYFRLSPILAECLDKLQQAFKKSEDIDEDEPILTIEQGYMTQTVHNGMVDREFLETVEGMYFQSTDRLDNSPGKRDHRTGNAVLISTQLDHLDAVTVLVKTLGPLVRSRGLYLGVALHTIAEHPCDYYNKEGIYFDIRKEANSAWVTYNNFFVQGVKITSEYFEDQVMGIFKKLSRYVNPYSGAGSIVPPRPQDPNFEYIPPGRFEMQEKEPCLLSPEQAAAFIIEPLQEEYDYEEFVRFKCRNGRKLWLPLVDGQFAETMCAYGELDDLIPELCEGGLLDEFDEEKKPKKRRVEKRSIGGKSEKDLQHERWCNVTEIWRKETAQSLWQIVDRRSSARDKFELREELKQCFWHLCGNRVKGHIWKEKVKHCSNFLHWMPTGAKGLVENPTLHQSEDASTIRMACGGENNCVEKTDLHAHMSRIIEKRFQSKLDPTIEFQLYSDHMNPLPLLEIVDEIFAMSVTGKVTVYLKKYTAVGALENTLKAIMTYNQNVDEVVFAVLNQTKPDSSKYEAKHLKVTNLVYNSVTRMVEGWTKLANPSYARESIAPFSVEVVVYPPEDPAEINGSEPYVKRIKKKREWEFKWLEKLQNM